MLRYGVLVGCVCLLAGCSPSAAPDTHDADVQAIKDTEAACVKDVATKDIEKWLACYSDDGAVLLPNAPAISGKDNLRAALKPMVADPNFALTFSSTKVDVAKSGDLAYSQGTYSMTATDPRTKQPTTEHGKYITVFKKEGGSWKAVEDMISSDMPAPGDSR
jgi:ketosteroid isomerase-like protein